MLCTQHQYINDVKTVGIHYDSCVYEGDFLAGPDFRGQGVRAPGLPAAEDLPPNRPYFISRY